MLSTKWVTSGYLNQGGNREVAWLDVTMNSGNSGGPIVLMGEEPEGDKVIGIASFGLNPFAILQNNSLRLFKRFLEVLS